MEKIDNYKNAVNFYNFNVSINDELIYKDFHNQLEVEFEKKHNEELFKTIQNVVTNFKFIIFNIIKIFKETNRYIEQNNNKTSLEEYLGARVNNIAKCEYEIKNHFTNLKYTIISIENFILNGKNNNAIYLKNYCNTKINQSTLFLEHMGIDLSKTIFKDYFDNLQKEIKRVIDINELEYTKKNYEPNLQQNQNIEPEPKPEKFTIPQIIKILDELNIRASMNEKNGLTDFQTIQLLADIFGRTERTIRNNFENKKHTTTAKNYIDKLKNLKAKR